jgi:acetolactate synthase-1/2/3 large subunit
MTFEELVVAAEHSLPVLFVVFENNTLGLVRQMQLSRKGGRAFATEMRCPDFVKMASACGVRGFKATSLKKLEAAVAKAVKLSEPVLIEVSVDSEAQV